MSREEVIFESINIQIKKLFLEFDQNMALMHLKICHAIGEQFPETTLATEFLD